ncbi:MAG: pyridoxal phosphate-dependent aminotransferase [Acidobacteriota bacterium]
MRLPARVRSIEEPQFDLLNTLAARHRARGADVITLGQAIPGFAPPASALAALRAAADDTTSHVYSADAGTAELRAALAEHLSRIASERVQKVPQGSQGFRQAPGGSDGFAKSANPEREMIITAGGNQAFQLALMTLVDAGDEVLLPAPFFLNHQMAIQSVGAVPVEVPLDPASGFVPTWEAIAGHVTAKTRAIVLCSPSNPTGAVTPPAELQRIVDHCRTHDLVCLIDETYLRFVYDDEPFPATALTAWRDAVAVIGSFSKAYAVTGWRLGYLIANEDVIAQAMKIQDSMLICASVPIQIAMTTALRQEPDYPVRYLDELKDRRDYLLAALRAVPGLRPVAPGGGFFVMVEMANGGGRRAKDSGRTSARSREVALALIEQEHVVTIPGRFFGETGEGFLRLSYGNAPRARLEEAVARLGRFFAQLRSEV